MPEPTTEFIAWHERQGRLIDRATEAGRAMRGLLDDAMTIAPALGAHGMADEVTAIAARIAEESEHWARHGEFIGQCYRRSIFAKERDAEVYGDRARG